MLNRDRGQLWKGRCVATIFSNNRKPRAAHRDAALHLCFRCYPLLPAGHMRPRAQLPAPLRDL